MRQSVYQDRINELSSTAVVLNARDKKYSIFRLFFFLIAVGFSIFLASYGWLYVIPCIIISLVLFSRLLRYHGTIIKERKLTDALINLNKNEIKSMDNDHSGFSNGTRYHDDKHPYTTDMDVFGDHSVFQMLNRASTIFGENKLAEVLSKRLPKNDIVNYQLATQELASKLDWRQRLYGLGKLDIEDHHDYSGLRRWINSDNPLNTSKVLVYMCVLFCWTLFVALMFYGVPLIGALLAFLPNVLLSYCNNKPITQIHALLDRNEKYIKPYADVVLFLETSKFNSDILQTLKSNFLINNGVASGKLRSLASYLKQLDIRTNFWGFLFCYGFLWDHIYAMKVEAWKSENKDSLFKWLQTIGEYEYISSIANFSFQNPEFCFPMLSDTAGLAGLQIGHPLIHSQQRVDNDFSMKTQKHIKIVTGSNMGGKSTFLRTLGVNMILAYSASKVSAKELSLPYLRLMSSMRTTDALKENTSSFYAELMRLKMILDEVKKTNDVFFLLDEILKGTNSNDRHIGAKAMINQMIANNGSGLVSTHDLELGEMIKELPEEIDNICFEVNVEGEELVFDYKIKDGISKSFNATHLMRNIGIEI